jgi:hypothetical protein
MIALNNAYVIRTATDERRFPFNPTNSASIEKARQAALEFESQELARLSKIAGRPLKPEELEGVQHVDDMDRRAKSVSEMWQIVPITPKTEEKGLYETYMEYVDENHASVDTSTPHGRRKQLALRTDAKIKAEIEEQRALEAEMNRPERLRAIQAARETLEQIAFDPTAPESLFRRARHNLRQVTEGDLAASEQATINSALAAHKAGKVETLQAEMNKLAEQINRLRPPEVEPPRELTRAEKLQEQFDRDLLDGSMSADDLPARLKEIEAAKSEEVAA